MLAGWLAWLAGLAGWGWFACLLLGWLGRVDELADDEEEEACVGARRVRPSVADVAAQRVELASWLHVLGLLWLEVPSP